MDSNGIVMTIAGSRTKGCLWAAAVFFLCWDEGNARTNIQYTVFPSMPSFCFYQSTEHRGEELGEGKRDATVVVDGVAMRYNFVFFDLSTLRNGMVHAQYRSAVGLCQFVLLLTLG